MSAITTLAISGPQVNIIKLIRKMPDFPLMDKVPPQERPKLKPFFANAQPGQPLYMPGGPKR